jgi:pimeloyl-ACP methyl ester carboxylesterase
MATFNHDGIEFHFENAGAGLPFIFQHGLGGDTTQPFGLFTPPPGIRLLTFDSRAHGKTKPVPPPETLCFRTFGQDLEAFLDHVKIEQAIVGGISMGAALALHFALRCPHRVIGLVLSRPAWLEKPYPWNVRMFSSISSFIRKYGTEQGLAEFKKTPEYLEALEKWPDVATSFTNQFLAPGADETALKLERIITDSPHPNRQAWSTIRVPTLVLGNQLDPIHPFDFAVELARAIPGAKFEEITSKSVRIEQHQADVQRVVTDFLMTFLQRKTSN